MFVQSGSWIAGEASVDVDTKWGGAKTFFPGEGLFLLKCSGQATCWSRATARSWRGNSRRARSTRSTPATSWRSRRGPGRQCARSGVGSPPSSRAKASSPLHRARPALHQTRSPQDLIGWLTAHLPHSGTSVPSTELVCFRRVPIRGFVAARAGSRGCRASQSMSTCATMIVLPSMAARRRLRRAHRSRTNRVPVRSRGHPRARWDVDEPRGLESPRPPRGGGRVRPSPHARTCVRATNPSSGPAGTAASGYPTSSARRPAGASGTPRRRTAPATRNGMRPPR